MQKQRPNVSVKREFNEKFTDCQCEHTSPYMPILLATILVYSIIKVEICQKRVFSLALKTYEKPSILRSRELSGLNQM